MRISVGPAATDDPKLCPSATAGDIAAARLRRTAGITLKRIGDDSGREIDEVLRTPGIVVSGNGRADKTTGVIRRPPLDAGRGLTVGWLRTPAPGV
jgi:hypothetical protein